MNILFLLFLNAKNFCVYIGDVKVLSPTHISREEDANALSVITSNLVGLSKTGENIFILAESYKTENNKKIFKLRKNIKYFDGSPIKAHHFINTIKQIVSPESTSPYKSMVNENLPIVNMNKYSEGQLEFSQVGLYVENEYNLIFEFDKEISDDLFFKTLSFCIFIPTPDYIDWLSDNYGYSSTNFPCSGQFIFDKNWNSGDTEMKLKKNSYFVFPSKLNNLTLISVDMEQESILNGILSGDIDYVRSLTHEQYSALGKNSIVKTSEFSNGEIVYLNINNTKIQCSELRKAISYMINRKELENIIDPSCKGAFTFVGKDLWSQNEDLKFDVIEKTNKNKAKDLMKIAKKKLKKSKLNFELHISSNDSVHYKLAIYLQEILRKIDIEIRILQILSSQRVYFQKTGNFELSIGRWVIDIPVPEDVLRLLKGDSPLNYSKFYDENFEEKWYKALSEINPEIKNTLLKKCEQIAFDLKSEKSFPIIPLFFKMGYLAYSSKFKEIQRFPCSVLIQEIFNISEVK